MAEKNYYEISQEILRLRAQISKQETKEAGIPDKKTGLVTTKPNWSINLPRGKQTFIKPEFEGQFKQPYKDDLGPWNAPVTVARPKTPMYWNDGRRIGRYYYALQSLPPGTETPAWLDKEGIEAAFKYLSATKENQHWTNWGTIPDDDPLNFITSQMQTPPPGMMPLWEQAKLADDYETNKPLTDQDIDLFSGQSNAEYELLPDWMKLYINSMPVIQTAIPALGAAIQGSMVFGWPGAIVAAAGTMLGVDAAMKNPEGGLAKLFNILNIPAANTEKALGLLEQIGYSIADPKKYGNLKEIFDDLGASYDAGRLFHETQFLTRTSETKQQGTYWLDNYDKTHGTNYGGNAPLKSLAGDATLKTKYYKKWTIGKADPEIVLLPDNMDAPAYAMREMRRMISIGYSADQAYGKLLPTFGDLANLKELVGNMLIDPTNLLGVGALKAIGKVGDLTGNVRIWQAFGNAGDVLQGTRNYGVLLRQMPASDVSNLSAVSKWIGGFDQAGNLKSLAPGARKGVFDYMLGLTPKARATEMVNNYTNGLANLISSENDAAAIIKMVEGIAKTLPGDAVKAVDNGFMTIKVGGEDIKVRIPEWFNSAEAQAVPNSIKEAVPGLYDLLDQYKMTRPGATLIEKIAAFTGDTPEKLIKQLHEGDNNSAQTKLNTFLLKMEDAARKGDKQAVVMLDLFRKDPELKAMTGERLKTMGDSFFGKNAAPYNVDIFKLKVMETISGSVDKYAAKWFDVKPPRLAIRVSNLVKRAQGYLLLGFNPSYMMNNGLNNMFTLAWDGLLHTDNIIGRRAFMKDFGWTPTRYAQGVGAGEMGDINMATFSSLTEGGKFTLGENIRKAGRGSDTIQAVDDFMRKGNKYQIAGVLSSKLESWASEIAMVGALKEYWGRAWDVGKGFPKMTDDLRLTMDAVQPGLAKKAEKLIKRGMSKKKIDGALFGNLKTKSIKDVLSADEMSALNKLPGLLDRLEKSVSEAKTPEEIRLAISNAKADAQTRISEQITRNMGKLVEDAVTKARTERTQGVLDGFDNMAQMRHDFWLRHFDAMAAVGDQAAKASGWQRQMIWGDALIQADMDWKNFSDIEGAKYLGFFRGLGAEDGSPVNTAVMGIYSDMRKTWDGFYSRRRQEMSNFHDAAFKLYDDGNADGAAALWRDMNDRLNTEYIKSVMNEDNLTGGMDNLFVEQYALQFEDAVKARAEAVRWRSSVQVERRKMIQAQLLWRNGAIPAEALAWGTLLDPKFIKQVTDLNGGKPLHTMGRAGRDKASPEFYKLYTRFIESQFQASTNNAPGMPGNTLVREAPITEPNVVVDPRVPETPEMPANAREMESTAPIMEPEATAAVEPGAVPAPEVEAPTYTPRQPDANLSQQTIDYWLNKYSDEEVAAVAKNLEDNMTVQQAALPEPKIGREATYRAIYDTIDDPIQAEATQIIFDSFADTWARQEAGRTTDDWFETFIVNRGGTEIGGEGIAQNAQGNAPTFYSQVERVLDAMMPNKATAEQIKGILNGTVKLEELQWMGGERKLTEAEIRTEQTITAQVKQELLSNIKMTKDAADKVFRRLSGVTDTANSELYTDGNYFVRVFKPDPEGLHQDITIYSKDFYDDARDFYIDKGFRPLDSPLPIAEPVVKPKNLWDAEKIPDTTKVENVEPGVKADGFPIVSQKDRVDKFGFTKNEVNYISDKIAEFIDNSDMGKIVKQEIAKPGYEAGNINYSAFDLTGKTDPLLIDLYGSRRITVDTLEQALNIYKRLNKKAYEGFEKVKYVKNAPVDRLKPYFSGDAYTAIRLYGSPEEAARILQMQIVNISGNESLDTLAASRVLVRLQEIMKMPQDKYLDEINKAMNKGNYLFEESSGKYVTDMTPEEMRAALLVDSMTGLKNRRAYEDDPRLPYQMAVDLEGLKFINDTYGHKAGDDALVAIADAMKEVAGDNAYRGSDRGDEFLAQFHTLEEAQAAGERLKEVADQKIIELGGKPTQGLGLDYGIGTTLLEADAALNNTVASNKASGKRANRGEQPKRLRPAGEEAPASGAPIGTVEQMVNAPTEEMIMEGWMNTIAPILDGLQERLANEMEPGVDSIADALSPEQLREFKKYMGEVYRGMSDTKMAANRYAESRRNFALLDYSQRYGFDDGIGMVMPYQFWMGRSAVNWMGRLMANPAILRRYLALTNYGQDAEEREGFPQRLQGKVRIPLPFLPESMGNSIYIDPFRQVFPFEAIARPFTQLAQDNNLINRRTESILQQWIANEEVTEQEAAAAAQARSGDLWDKAMLEARATTETEMQNPFDFAFAISSPSLPLSIAYNFAMGRKDRISQMPITRTLQNLTASMGIGGERGINIEASIRKLFGLPEVDQFEDYRVNRELSNMVAEGKYQPAEAITAMIDKSGTAFKDAQRRVSEQGLPKQLGSSIGLDFFPEGEQEQRKLATLYGDAIDKWVDGDKQALTDFWEEHPEYEARMVSLADSPEKQLAMFLRSKVWNGWMALSSTEKRNAVGVFGSTFEQAFLNTETRSYDSISNETLAVWAKSLGKDVPEAVQDQPTVSGFQAPTEIKTLLNQYDAEKAKKFPGIGDVLNEYFSVDENSRALIQRNTPIIDQYYSWRNNFIASHPAVAPYLTSESSELFGLPGEIQSAVYSYRAQVDKYFPNIYDIQTGYFDIEDKTKKKAYLKTYPILPDYWDFRKEYAAANPKAAPYVMSDESLAKSILGEDYVAPVKINTNNTNYYPQQNMDESVLRMIADYYYNGNQLKTGAKIALENIWKSLGSPAGSLENWLNAYVLPMVK